MGGARNTSEAGARFSLVLQANSLLRMSPRCHAFFVLLAIYLPVSRLTRRSSADRGSKPWITRSNYGSRLHGPALRDLPGSSFMWGTLALTDTAPGFYKGTGSNGKKQKPRYVVYSRCIRTRLK